MTRRATIDIPAPVAVVGPTASGKSRLAEDLAVSLGGEVVSADSMQVYRGMDIGTAKTAAHDRRVPLHCVDLVDPGEPFSAALFQRHARAVIDRLRSAGLVPVIAGGTGLYVRAALDTMTFPAGAIESPSRAALEALAAEIGPDALHERLAAVDPRAAALIHPHNVRRTVRALEMHAGGASYAEQVERFGAREAVYPGTRLLGLTLEREELYRRINDRVDAMLAIGLVAEVEGLLRAGYRDALTATQAIGYKEIVPVLDGAAPLEDAVESIKRASRRYAKRQLTWFRADPRVIWLDATGMTSAEVTERALHLLESAGQPS